MGNLYLIQKTKLDRIDFNNSLTYYPEDYVQDITGCSEWIEELTANYNIPEQEILDKLNCGELLLDSEGDLVVNNYHEAIKYVDCIINDELDVFGNYEPPYMGAVWGW